MTQRCEVHSPPQPGICQVCAKYVARKRATKRALIVAAGAAAVTAGVVIFMSTRPTKKPPPPKPEGDLLEQPKRERLAADPCNETHVLDLVDHLMMNGQRWSEALAVLNDTQKRCTTLTHDMKRRKLVLHQQLTDWGEASLLIEETIAAYPRDTRAWWQHGETWRYRDQNELALVDFRQSLSNAFWDRGATAVLLFMYAAEAVDAPCEAERAWRYYQRALGGGIDIEGRNLVTQLAREKTCVPEHGTGRAKFQIGKKEKATFGSEKANLLIDSRAGTTIISREIAEKAGIKPLTDGKTATLWSEVQLQGQPARAPVMTLGNLAAKNVEVVICDDLAIGDDGVVGMSFLWHFDFERHGWAENESIVLEPRGD